MTEIEHQQSQSPRRRTWLVFAPVIVFAVLAAIFAKGLTNTDPGRIPSVLLGKPVPDFELPALAELTIDGKPVAGLSTNDLKTGEVTLVNVWASWCGPCRQEHPHLMALANDHGLRIAGLNYKDKPENARRFLGSLGNPYKLVGVDDKGSAAVDWGVYGVPETFLVDGAGVIRYKWIGPITAQALKEELLPRVRSTQAKTSP
ncbi:MAG: DsbE family thiol:disulfide interchange protein [Rhizobiales bacterium]|nr:DsbE family thiol:disulfide interchange protein [Hyphomicrobiales bacterium]